MSREVASVRGRLVLDDRIEPGRIAIEDGWIAEIELVEPVDGGPGRTTGAPATEELPYIAPGFVDVHVHGGGGHDAMGGARRPRRDGPPPAAARGDRVPADGRDRAAAGPRHVRRDASAAWLPGAPADGAEPLGFNLEGPFLAEARRGAHDPAFLRAPGRRRPARPRAAPRRAAPDHDRAGAAGRPRAHRLAPASAASRRRWATRPRPSTRRAPAMRPAAAPRPTCSTR